MLEEKYRDIITHLINEELNSGKVFQFTVSTLSMHPLIKPGDKIMVRKGPSETLKCGDIVVFEEYGELCTHRLLCNKISNSKIKFITKGDNSLVIDRPISKEELLGKVVGIKRGSKFIDLESRFWKIVNGMAGTLSYLEWIVFNFLSNIKRLILRFE